MTTNRNDSRSSQSVEAATDGGDDDEQFSFYALPDNLAQRILQAKSTSDPSEGMRDAENDNVCMDLDLPVKHQSHVSNETEYMDMDICSVAKGEAKTEPEEDIYDMYGDAGTFFCPPTPQHSRLVSCNSDSSGTADYGTADYGTADYGTADYGTADYGTADDGGAGNLEHEDEYMVMDQPARSRLQTFFSSDNCSEASHERVHRPVGACLSLPASGSPPVPKSHRRGLTEPREFQDGTLASLDSTSKAPLHGSDGRLFGWIRKKKPGLTSTMSLHEDISSQDEASPKSPRSSRGSMKRAGKRTSSMVVKKSQSDFSSRLRTISAPSSPQVRKRSGLQTEPDEVLTATGLQLLNLSEKDIPTVVHEEDGTMPSTKLDRRRKNGFLRSGRASPEDTDMRMKMWSSDKNCAVSGLSTRDNGTVSAWAHDQYLRATFFPTSEAWLAKYADK